MKDQYINIRVVTDIPLLLKWREEVLKCVFSIPHDEDISTLIEENERYMTEHLRNDIHIECIASVDGVDCGCGAICIYDEMPSPDNFSGKCAYIMNIYVRETFRRHNVGNSIVDFLVAEARRRGVGKIYLESSDMARKFYADRGFIPMDGMMKLPSDAS